MIRYGTGTSNYITNARYHVKVGRYGAVVVRYGTSSFNLQRTSASLLAKSVLLSTLPLLHLYRPAPRRNPNPLKTRTRFASGKTGRESSAKTRRWVRQERAAPTLPALPRPNVSRTTAWRTPPPRPLPPPPLPPPPCRRPATVTCRKRRPLPWSRPCTPSVRAFTTAEACL